MSVDDACHQHVPAWMWANSFRIESRAAPASARDACTDNKCHRAYSSQISLLRVRFTQLHELVVACAIDLDPGVGTAVAIAILRYVSHRVDARMCGATDHDAFM